MTTRRSVLLSFAGALALSTSLASGVVFAAEAFDLSPAQTARIRSSAIPDAVARIPADFKFVKPGVLTIGIHPWDPPIATYATDGATPVGADPDLAFLVADALGLQLELVPVAWADWPLGLASGKFDAVISNVTVTEERKEKFDFSTYRKDVLGFYVKADSPITSITEPKDVAGLKVITGAGTNQEKIILEWNRQNVEAGLKPIDVLYFDDSAAEQLAIASGRADVKFDPNAPQAYAAATNGLTKLVGVVSGGWPIAADIAVTTRKGSGIADAITEAVNGQIASGNYQKALQLWKIEPEAVDKAQTNPPGLPKT